MTRTLLPCPAGEPRGEDKQEGMKAMDLGVGVGCVSGQVEEDPRGNSETSGAALSFMEDDTHREGLSTPVPRDLDAGQASQRWPRFGRHWHQGLGLLCSPSPNTEKSSNPLSAIKWEQNGSSPTGAVLSMQVTLSPTAHRPGYLVWGNVCVWREGQHAHDLADLIQLAPFGLTEVFPCMSKRQQFDSKFVFSSLRI